MKISKSSKFVELNRRLVDLIDVAIISLKSFEEFLISQEEIAYLELPIDCDVDPFVPLGYTVESHKKCGQFKFSLGNIAPLYLSKKQKKRGRIEGNELRKELESENVLNAIVLDYLLANPILIPDEWKDKYIFFWGTIYRRSNGNLCVRYLHWNGSAWRWSSLWLGFYFNSDNPAILASSL